MESSSSNSEEEVICLSSNSENERDESVTDQTDDSAMEEEENDQSKEASVANKDFKNSLYQILKVGKSNGGDFAVSGELKAPLCIIEVKDFGKIGFPIYENQAVQLIKHLERAPFGKGTETVVDTTVRNSWQLDPTKFQILNPGWKTFVENEFLPLLAKEFEIQNKKIGATLYKLLLYESGSFFKLHRDTEKETGMFGTLIIQLPSDYEGGELVIQHDGKTKKIDFSSGEGNPSRAFCTFYSALYCDCEHELLPVQNGYRVCLIYNLTSIGTNNIIPIAPKMSSTEMELTELLKNWPSDAQTKMVFVLTHKYSKVGLSFQNLKTTDKALADLLRKVSKEFPLIVALGQLTKQVSGQAENDDFYERSSKRSRWGRSPSPDYSDLVHYNDKWVSPEIDYTFNIVATMENDSDWHGKDLDINIKKEVMPPNCFKRLKEPTEVEYEGYAGNHPGTLDHFYKLAALIFWPTANFFKMIKHGPFPLKIILSKFLEMVDAMGDLDEEDKIKIHSLSKELLESLGPGKLKTYESIEAQVIQTMNIVADVGNLELLQNFLDKFAMFGPKFVLFLNAQCEKHGWGSLLPQLKTIVDSLPKVQAVDLLQTLVGDFEHSSDKKKENLTILVNSILAKESERLKNKDFFAFSWFTRTIESPNFEEDKKFAFGLFLLCHKLKIELLEFVKSMPKTQKLEVYGPTCLSIVTATGPGFLDAGDPFIRTIAMYLISYFESIVSEYDLNPPTMKRSEKINCTCTDCRHLQEFLSANRQTQTFRMGKDRRRHLHEHLNKMKDITHETVRIGNPQPLIVTKNHCSKQTKEKLDSTELLRKMKATFPVVRVPEPDISTNSTSGTTGSECASTPMKN